MEKKAEYQLSSSMNEGILEIIITGELVVSAYEKITNEVSAITKANGVEKALVDVRALNGCLGIAVVYDRVRDYSQHMYKIHFAIVDIPGNDRYKTFHEYTLMKAGMRVKWFTDIDAARDWLNGELDIPWVNMASFDECVLF